jgi:hypothetical protein
MQRRTFLQLGTGALTVAAASQFDKLARRSGLRIDASAVFPGAPIEVTLDSATPVDWQTQLAVAHDDQPPMLQAVSVIGGQTCTVRVPCPAELVPGRYHVLAVLRDATGKPVESHEIGSYTVRRMPFSA